MSLISSLFQVDGSKEPFFANFMVALSKLSTTKGPVYTAESSLTMKHFEVAIVHCNSLATDAAVTRLRAGVLAVVQFQACSLFSL